MKLITMIIQALRLMSTRHTWMRTKVAGVEHRTCTTCGQHDYDDFDDWGHFWLTKRAGDPTKHHPQ